MAVRIYLEIGHEASIRNKKTQEGFTHDWEVFVRGCEGAEIHYFIEKVVFYLHETFPKPKRVVKEPPYSVKESGYAGFNLPIDIYLRNNSEPKKIRFNYDLHLQQSGPPILKVQKEKYVFNSPSEEFKMKLLKGGAIIGSSSSLPDVNDTRSLNDDKNQMTNKPKLSGCDLIKKPKIKTGEPRDFQELFGSPITMSSKSNSEQKLQVPKSDSKGLDKSRTKHSPHKDSHKDKEKSKDKTDSEKKSKEEKQKQKEKSKDRERSKDKNIKKEKSPRPRSPTPKRSPKRSTSPSRFSSPPVVKHKEPKQHDKEKRDKFEDRKMKKEKRSKDHKENKHTDEQKSSGTNEEHKEKPKIESKKQESSKIKNETPASPPPKVAEKKEKTKDKSSSKEPLKEEKTSEKSYSEKYKHKKKDKEKKEKKEERTHKSEKKPEKSSETKTNLFKAEAQPIKKEKVPNYLGSVIPNVDEDSSNSSTSSSSSSVVERQTVEKKVKNETIKVKEEKNQKLKKEKGFQDSAIKCKRKSNSGEVEEPPEKLHKEHNVNNNSDGEQEVQGKTVLPTPQEEEENYFEVLRDLQHKIMGLKDNSDLQKVVKLIAETGRYEVSAHTFDFDLCLLDRSTVQQLQDFFANET